MAGDVGFVQKNLNDQVKKGEKLVEIDVPDLVAEVKAKASRDPAATREIDLAQKQWEIAVAAEKVAHATIGQREADQRAAEATAAYRKLRLDRFTQLAKGGGVVESVVEEEQRDYLAAQAAAESAAEAVNKARADYAQAQVNSDAAKTEIDLRKAMNDVAVRDKEMAEAQLSYATISAPFDGVVVDRNTNPGDFVQNATTAQTPPLISVARVDLVTISMEVPDGFAPYVSRGADAEFRVGDLFAHGKVTRYSPSIESKDRTMHVEVDLFNGTASGRLRQVRARASRQPGPKSEREPTIRFRSGRNSPARESEAAAIRCCPAWSARCGCFCEKFDNVFLIPSEAVFIRSGRTFIAEVIDGKVAIKEVKCRPTTARSPKCCWSITNRRRTAMQRVFNDLTGSEQIALHGQGAERGRNGRAITEGVVGPVRGEPTRETASDAITRSDTTVRLRSSRVALFPTGTISRPVWQSLPLLRPLPNASAPFESATLCCRFRSPWRVVPANCRERTPCRFGKCHFAERHGVRSLHRCRTASRSAMPRSPSVRTMCLPMHSVNSPNAACPRSGLLQDLDLRHTDVLDQLDDLNRRVRAGALRRPPAIPNGGCRPASRFSRRVNPRRELAQFAMPCEQIVPVPFIRTSRAAPLPRSLTPRRSPSYDGSFDFSARTTPWWTRQKSASLA